ncbi:hypothetical protein BC937DRAFT_89407 [Endogone sp. FLAS-F59071]|nr:hypothetical protein BC937DRAFT_89407 [Endogone sp. FLAS-F59071]|eukprot:RUS22404.1 hypothetical protein BC937DRAFT_89407 [Endogone sp. FLAS-F59071]
MLRVKFDENCMELMTSVFGESDGVPNIGNSDADNVVEENLRGEADLVITKQTLEADRTLVTCDTDFLVEPELKKVGVVVLWGRLAQPAKTPGQIAQVPFVRLSKAVRGTVVTYLFRNYRQEIDRIRAEKEKVMAILSGDLNNYLWTIRRPTDAEIERFHVKYVGKLILSALPFSRAGELTVIITWY